MNRIRGWLAHAVMHAPPYFGDWRWWVWNVEAPAIAWCAEHHPEEWEEVPGV